MKSVIPLLLKTHRAATSLRNASGKKIQSMLLALSDQLLSATPALIKSNAKDLARQLPGNTKNDRLLLNASRIGSIAASIANIARLPDPSHRMLDHRLLKNGIRLEKISVPLGVVGAIYESRPNVTFDIAALCLRSRNACVLKGSIEAENTNRTAAGIIRKVLITHGFNPDIVTLLPSDREVVKEMFTATSYLDVIIPRGSDGLIQYVRQNSRVPVIETGAGVCHVYIERRADLAKAVAISVNAKVSRPSVCNAADAILVDKPVAEKFLSLLAPEFEKYKVEIAADAAAHRLLRRYTFLQKATDEDFGKEFLSLKCAIKVVNDIDEALLHIAQYSTKHSEAIVSKNKGVCERFIREVDAAAVYSNASTRFTDGEEFGLGAEIGISTQKLHARGPFALEKLVTEKWILRGDGQIR